MNNLIITIKKLFTPFEVVDKKVLNSIVFVQIFIILYAWTYWTPTKSFFPSLGEVLTGWLNMWKNGLFYHIWQTLKLCLTATIISVIFSCIIAYSSKMETAINSMYHYY